jgi:hypothetical protein
MKLKGLALASASAVICFAIPSAASAGADEEAQKTAARLIAQAVSDRIAANPAGPGATLAGGEATDQSVWLTGSRTTGGFGNPLYQALAGYDTKVSENALIGVNANYSRLNASVGSGATGFKFKLNSVGVAPYFGYNVSDTFFWSGLVGVSRTKLTGSSSGISISNKSTAVSGDISANVHNKGEGGVKVRGKVGYRVSHSSGFTAHSAVVGADLETTASEGLAFYANAEASGNLNHGFFSSVPLTVGAGLLFRPSGDNNIEVGGGYERTFQKFTDSNTLKVILRSRF